MDRVVVLGLGNTLQMDDGVGVHAIRWLQQFEGSFSERVNFVDGGTISFPLLEIIEDAERLVVVDAVILGGDPGEISVFEGSAMDTLLVRHGAGSVHEVSLSELFGMARLRGYLPPYRALIGIEPQVVGWSETLSPIVSASLPGVARAIGRLLDGWNVERAQ
ncbi:MAG: HyaD/HybD family hydrogenase maturation endopeptidase [Acidiferrobacter sp.]